MLLCPAVRRDRTSPSHLPRTGTVIVKVANTALLLFVSMEVVLFNLKPSPFQKSFPVGRVISLSLHLDLTYFTTVSSHLFQTAGKLELRTAEVCFSEHKFVGFPAVWPAR